MLEVIPLGEKLELRGPILFEDFVILMKNLLQKFTPSRIWSKSIVIKEIESGALELHKK